MKDWQIEVSPFELLDTLNVEIHQRINEHATVTVKGRIAPEKEDEYVEMAQAEQWMSVKLLDTENGDQTLFAGPIAEVEIRAENSARIIVAKGISSSYLLDTRKQRQSFQDPNITYDKILDALKKHYDKLEIFMTEGRGEKAKEFVVQYDETDWAFAKRLASHFNSFIVPEYQLGGGARFYFGLPNRPSEQVTSNSYSMEKQVEEYRKKTENGLKLKEKDAICYRLRSREYYSLCTRIQLNGRPLVVAEVETIYQGAECIHTYILKTEEGLKTLYQPHPQISGAEIQGRVIAVEKDQVKVHLEIDEKQPADKARWFPYATIYSSPDGAGWYCMPEVEDQVRICFPNQKEENAYAASAVHLKGAEGRDDPEIKIWRTKYSKEIRFTPESIILTNNDGLQIELNDKKGILIASNKKVLIQAEGDLEIISESGSVLVNGSDEVKLQQNNSQLSVKKDITFAGAKVKVE